MDCQLLCLLAASIGFSSVDDIDWCGYCGDLQVTMDECIELKLDINECRQRFPDQQIYVYCLSIAQKYSTGAVNVIKRCVDKDAYKADVLTLDKQMLNTSLRCAPNRPSNFQSCECGDLCRVRTTTATEPTQRSTEPPTSSSTSSMTTTTTITTTTEPSSTVPSPPSTPKIAKANETTPGNTIIVADEADDCSHLRASSFLLFVVLLFRAAVLRDFRP